MAPPRCVIDPAATTNRANGTYNRHSARGGDDDPRRGNSLPREGLQLCVAPYFADGCRRHAGTVEVHRENATPEAVAGCHRTTLPTRYTADTQYTILGAIWGMPIGGPRMSPRPRVAKYGATHGCHHLPGWLKCPPLVIVSAVGGEADSALRPTTALRGCTFGTHYICIV